MDDVVHEIEKEKLNIAREQLQLDRVKERNASIRFFVGVLLVGVVTWAVNVAVSAEQGKRTLIQSERELILPQVIDIHKMSYEDQQQKLKVLLGEQLRLRQRSSGNC
jgi:hypothetical protein